jgi:hypothetical protein
MDAGASCFLLPKKHQSAYHRPDNAKRSTGLDGRAEFSSTRQVEWKIGNPAERKGRGTGYKMPDKAKDWNMSVEITENNRFPDRKQERQLSAFQAISQYDYNYRAEVLPKAELKGAPRYDKFHLDMSQGPAGSLRSSTNNFVGFTDADVPMLATKMSHSTKVQMPIHPRLDGPTHTIWNTGTADWKVSNQVVPKERAAAMEALDTKAQLNSTKTKMTMTKTKAYRSPVEIEAERIEEIRRLKSERKFVDSYNQPFRHTYRMNMTMPHEEEEAKASAQPGHYRPDTTLDPLPNWDGEISFSKARPGGSKTRTRWNYAAPC